MTARKHTDKAEPVRDTANTPENAGKEATIAKSPTPPANVPPEKEAPPATPGKTLSESDRQTLRRAFHLLLANRRATIDSMEDTMFKDNENKKSKGLLTSKDCDECLAEYKRFREEKLILNMLENGISPDSVIRAAYLTDGDIKLEWKSYLDILFELHLLFASPEELEA